MLQEVALPGAELADPGAFLPAAVQFANDRCWGNLSCSLFVSPQVCGRVLLGAQPAWIIDPMHAQCLDGWHRSDTDAMQPRSVCGIAVGGSSARSAVSLQVQAQHQEAFEEAVAGLRYGCVCVNVTSMMGFCIARLPWGAFPGNTPEVGI